MDESTYGQIRMIHVVGVVWTAFGSAASLPRCLSNGKGSDPAWIWDLSRNGGTSPKFDFDHRRLGIA